MIWKNLLNQPDISNIWKIKNAGLFLIVWKKNLNYLVFTEDLQPLFKTATKVALKGSEPENAWLAMWVTWYLAVRYKPT